MFAFEVPPRIAVIYQYTESNVTLKGMFSQLTGYRSGTVQ